MAALWPLSNEVLQFVARGCKSKKVPFFFSRQGKTMHEAESTVRQLAEAPMNRIVYQAGCIDRVVDVAGESSEAMREVEDEGTQISVRLVEAGQGNPSHENVVLDNLLVRRGGYDELLLTLLVRTAEMSDRCGIVRYFWGECTAIMNGVATIRNGLAHGGSNRIAGGM